MTETEQLREALQNCLGFLDTPIARRKLGLDPSAEWLQEARKLAKKPTDLSETERRIMDWDFRDGTPVPTAHGKGVPIVYGGFTYAETPSGRKQSQPEIQHMPADAGAHKFTDYPLPKVGDRVVWTSDPDPTIKLTDCMGTVVSVSPDAPMAHFHVEPDDWKGAKIYATWNNVTPVRKDDQ